MLMIRDQGMHKVPGTVAFPAMSEARNLLWVELH